jgi:hypothetical protein
MFRIVPSACEVQLLNADAYHHVIYFNWGSIYVEMASPSEGEKETFFTRLDELDVLPWKMMARFRLNGSQATPSSIQYLRQGHYFSHSEASTSYSDLTLPRTARIIGSPAHTLKVTMPAQISKRKSQSGKAPSKPSKKQGGKKSLQLQPDGAQIFRGLIFCSHDASTFTS